MNTQEEEKTPKRKKLKMTTLFFTTVWPRLSGCSAERSSMCFRDCSGRGRAETAGSRRQTGNSWLIKHCYCGQRGVGVWGPRSNQAINPTLSTSWSKHLSAARRTTPRHRLSATRHIPLARRRHFQKPLHNQPDWLTWDLQVIWPDLVVEAMPLTVEEQVSLSLCRWSIK